MSGNDDGHLSFRGELGRPTGAEPLDPDRALHIAVLGDFSGRSRNSETSDQLDQRRPIRVDRDNIEQVMAGMPVRLRGILKDREGKSVDLQFQSLDDFHPDNLYQQIPLFDELRQTRRGLLNSGTYQEAADRVKQWGVEIGKQSAESTSGTSPAPASDGPPPAPADLSGMDPSQLLDQAIAETGDDSAADNRSPASDTEPSAMVRQLLDDVVRPHIVPKPDAERDDLVAWVDAMTSDLMHQLLHHRDFQALEAAWRGVDFLVRNVQTSEKIHIYLLDVAKRELFDDLAAGQDLENSHSYRLLASKGGTMGQTPWGLLLGNYMFDLSIEDALLSGALANLASHVRAPFVAGASSHLVGCPTFADGADVSTWKELTGDVADVWREVRSLPQMQYVGLAAPRFLLRLPYGADTEPIDRFAFEEQPKPSQHDRYLWGNSALIVGCLIARAYDEAGWDMGSLLRRNVQEMDGFPLHVYNHAGSTELKPVAECWMHEKSADRIMEAGCIPIAAMHRQDRIRVLRFQSMLEPVAPLAGL